MSKENIARNLQIQSAGDCLSESVCTIVNHLAPEYFLHPVSTQDALGTNTDSYLTNFFDLLEQNRLGVVHHDLLRIENNPEVIFKTLELALQEGALCEVTVNAHPWVKEIRKKSTSLPKDDITHSLVVYGCYRPAANVAWFYVADPYTSDHVFVNWHDLIRLLKTNKNKVSINIFSIFNNHHHFLVDRSAKKRYLDQKVKRKILSELKGRNTGEKLRFMLHPKKSASRPRS